jgi:hypothetical protein
MRQKQLCVFPLLAVAVLALQVRAFGQDNLVTYQQIATIDIPGGLSSFDISWVDPANSRFYITDRTSVVGGGRIDVIDTQANQLLYTIPTTATEIGFAGPAATVTPGCTISGPNGVVAIPQLNQLYVGDGDSTVKVVDLAAKAVVAIIPTGGKCRADELGYDPLDHIILIANPNDSPPFVTFISTDTQQVVGKYVYQGRVGGLEQPVWNRMTKRFYMTVPSTATSPGSIDVFNPVTMKLEQSISTPTCSPAGLALTTNQHMFTSCGAVVDGRTGDSIATITGVGGDEIWYNPGDHRIYFGATGGAVGVVDGDTFEIVGTIPVNGRNVSVDSETGRVFVPVAGQGILVFTAP